MPANSALRKLPALLLGILLGVCLLAYYSTRDSAPPASQRNASAAGQPLVDTSLLQSVMSLSALAATPDEQAQAREAWRFADHELDLRFAATIRRAEAEATAQAHLDLDQDELDGAQQDLVHKGGDKRATLQHLLQEHEASDKIADQAVKFGSLSPTGTMSEQIR